MVDDLDRQITLVQKSTKTLFRFMIPAHEWCRNESKKYYQWHVQSYSETVHWTVVVVALVAFGAGMHSVWPFLIS